jgi:hypothetical protein
MDTLMLSWVNPYRAAEMYPEGVPEILGPSLKLALEALELADMVVTIV